MCGNMCRNSAALIPALYLIARDDYAWEKPRSRIAVCVSWFVVEREGGCWAKRAGGERSPAARAVARSFRPRPKKAACSLIPFRPNLLALTRTVVRAPATQARIGKEGCTP